MHAVAVVLDALLTWPLTNLDSCRHGHAAHAAMEAVVVLVEALEQLGVDWSLTTFGERVTLLKSEDSAWDADAQYTLLTHLTFDQQSQTQDAAAIDLAADALCAVPRRGDKHVLVITDGHSTTGSLALACAQARAERKGVQVTALGLGLERTAVPLSYRRWASVALTSELARALEALFSAESDGAALGGAAGAAGAALLAAASGGGPGGGSPFSSYAALLARAGAEKDAQEVLAGQRAVFDDLVRKLGGAAQLKVQHCQPDAMTLDLCFVIDCTGSMTAWIETCKVGLPSVC